MLALFLVLCLCAILLIWLLQMKTSVKVLTLFMIKLLQKLSAEFSRSNPVIISFFLHLFSSFQLVFSVLFVD